MRTAPRSPMTGGETAGCGSSANQWTTSPGQEMRVSQTLSEMLG